MKRNNIHSLVKSEQAVSVVIGALLIVSIMTLAAVQYQNNIIPAQEEETEFEHNREVRSSLYHLRSNIVASSSSGEIRTTPVDVGTRFDQQFIFGFLPAVHSPNPSGTFETYNVSDEEGLEVEITGAQGRGGASNYWQPTSTYEYSTSFANYSVDYEHFQDAPNVKYENSVMYDEVETASGTDTVIQTSQNIVQGNNINIIMLSGDIQTSTTQTVNVQAQPVSAPAQTVTIYSPPSAEGGPLQITIPTDLPQSDWCDLPACGGGEGEGILNEQMASQGGNINDFSYGGGEMTLRFQADETYTMKLSRVHLQTQNDQSVTPQIESQYVAWQGSERISFRENTRHTITAQVRDRYNNPVEGIDTVAVATDSNDEDECIGDFVSGTLGGIAGCPDNYQPGEKTSGENGEVTFFYDTPQVQDDTSINLQIELSKNSAYASLQEPGFRVASEESYESENLQTTN